MVKAKYLDALSLPAQDAYGLFAVAKTQLERLSATKKPTKSGPWPGVTDAFLLGAMVGSRLAGVAYVNAMRLKAL